MRESYKLFIKDGRANYTIEIKPVFIKDTSEATAKIIYTRKSSVFSPEDFSYSATYKINDSIHEGITWTETDINPKDTVIDGLWPYVTRLMERVTDDYVSELLK